MMPISVSDSLSNVDEQIVNAAKIIGRSKIRQRVFELIYFGKRQLKSVKDIAKTSRLSEKAVLTSGKRLADNNIISQKKTAGGTAYGKVPFCAAHKKRILDYARKPTKLSKMATKSTPKSTMNITIKHEGVKIRTKQITCEDLDEFARIKKVKVAVLRKIPEKTFKYGVAKLARQSGDFTDWGGERNDLYTSKIHRKGQTSSHGVRI
jgi:hypothetical protein